MIDIDTHAIRIRIRTPICRDKPQSSMHVHPLTVIVISHVISFDNDFNLANWSYNLKLIILLLAFFLLNQHDDFPKVAQLSTYNVSRVDEKFENVRNSKAKR